MKDAISVYSVFHAGKIKPLSFIWKHRRMKIEKITYQWNTIEEDGLNIHFSVICGEFYYHLLYTVSLSSWYILELESSLI